MGEFYSSVKSFLKEPFTTPMSFPHYVALVGFTIIVATLWVFVIKEIERGVAEI